MLIPKGKKGSVLTFDTKVRSLCLAKWFETSVHERISKR